MGGFVRAAGVMLAIAVLSGEVFTRAAPAPAAAPVPAPAPAMSLLTTGQFHGDEVTARSGEVWLGLFPGENGAYELRRTTLKVKAVLDPVLDPDEGPPSGKEVTVVDAREPLFLLKTGGRLRPRVVPIAFAPNAERDEVELRTHYRVGFQFQFRDSEYFLTVVDDEAREGKTDEAEEEETVLPGLPQRATLRLDFGVESQPLFSMTSHAEASWQLLWAGDLDGDGKLDLLLNLSTHYNVISRRLFLSSAAKKGQMVGQVAIFETVGC